MIRSVLVGAATNSASLVRAVTKSFKSAGDEESVNGYSLRRIDSGDMVAVRVATPGPSDATRARRNTRDTRSVRLLSL